MKQKLVDCICIIFIGIVVISFLITKYQEWQEIKNAKKVEVITGVPDSRILR